MWLKGEGPSLEVHSGPFSCPRVAGFLQAGVGAERGAGGEAQGRAGLLTLRPPSEGEPSLPLGAPRCPRQCSFLSAPGPRNGTGGTWGDPALPSPPGRDRNPLSPGQGGSN